MSKLVIFIQTYGKGERMVMDYVINAIFIVFLSCTVPWIVVRLYYFIKCIKVKKCSNRKCRFNQYCYKYQEVLTKEEVDELNRMIDQLLAEHSTE